MRVKKIAVENFRAIRSEALSCDNLTVLVGANGSGKSTFLQALMVFQDRQQVTAEDFYNRNTGEPIEITVTFADLSESATARFSKYVQNGELEIVRICRWNNGRVVSSLHGSSLRNPDFAAVFGADRAKDARALYDRLRGDPRYGGLPAWSSAEAARDRLRRWEEDHPDACERMADDGRFFGFAEVGTGSLGRSVKFLFVRAVRDAADYGTEGGRGSVLRELLDLTVKGALAGADRHKDLQKESDAIYERARDIAGLPEVEDLKRDISDTLGMIARGASVDLDWSLQAPAVPLPTASVHLVEDNYSSTIDRTGHGLQRAFIIAVLSRLSGAQARAAKGDAARGADEPSIVLIVEEPELYQHPSRARHLAGLLRSIAERGLPSVARSMQVVYATHSPYFVGADRIDRIRVLRKVPGAAEGDPLVVRVWQTSMADIERDLAAAGATRRTDRKREEYELDDTLTPMMSEGFFADTVVLVEGESDRIALVKAAETAGTPLDEAGVAVIHCRSKHSMLRPLAVFRRLGMRVYPVWDGDGDKKSERKGNRRILSLLGVGADDKGGWLGRITQGFACHEGTVEDALRSDVGEDLYDRLTEGYRTRYNLGKGDKKPLITHLLMREMEERGARLGTHERIVEAIIGGGAAGGPAP